MIRTFICIDIPQEVKQKMGAVQAEMKKHGRGVRWSNSNGIHLTLKFLGDIENEKVQQVIHQAEKACAGFSPFEISVQDTGAFPNFKRPRVFWIGVDEPSGLMLQLHGAIDNSLASIGFEKEQRRFSPHLTLGRVKSDDGLKDVSRALEDMTFEPMHFLARHVVLMKSELRPGGAVYTPLHTIKL